MIELQWLTGMRPGSMCIMRTCDIDTTGEIWIYTPAEHKTDHLEDDEGLQIAIGPKAQNILQKWLRPNLEEYLFQPAEAEADRSEHRRANRKTPLYPAHVRRYARQKPRRPERRAGGRYTPNTYRNAIRRACIKIGIDIWTPHQLRHAFATRVRKSFADSAVGGLEAARTALGHRHMRTTEIYAAISRQQAAEVAAKMG